MTAPVYQQIIVGALLLWVMWNTGNVFSDLIEIFRERRTRK